MILFWYILSTVGTSYIVTQSDLFKRMRDLAIHKYNHVGRCRMLWWWIMKIVTCPLCFGFYSGAFHYWMLYGFDIVGIICGGTSGSILSFFVFLLITKLKGHG